MSSGVDGMKKYFPKITLMLIALFLLAYVLDSLVLDGFLFKQGALNRDEVVTNRQWWRVITSAFLHSGVVHILLNIVTVYFAGVFLEPKIGGGRFLAVFCVSNIIVHVIYLLTWTFEVSSGGSAGLYGLMGVLAVFCIRDKKFLAQCIKNAGMYLLAVYFVVGVVRGGDALFMHSVGFVCGVLMEVFITMFFRGAEYSEESGRHFS